MTKLLESSCEARDNLLVARYRKNNTKATSVEISNIMKMVEVRVLSEKDKAHDLLRIFEASVGSCVVWWHMWILSMSPVSWLVSALMQIYIPHFYHEVIVVLILRLCDWIAWGYATWGYISLAYVSGLLEVSMWLELCEWIAWGYVTWGLCEWMLTQIDESWFTWWVRIIVVTHFIVKS